MEVRRLSHIDLLPPDNQLRFQFQLPLRSIPSPSLSTYNLTNYFYQVSITFQVLRVLLRAVRFRPTLPYLLDESAYIPLGEFTSKGGPGHSISMGVLYYVYGCALLLKLHGCVSLLVTTPIPFHYPRLLHRASRTLNQ